jgi:hypothetical protein
VREPVEALTNQLQMHQVVDLVGLADHQGHGWDHLDHRRRVTDHVDVESGRSWACCAELLVQLVSRLHPARVDLELFAVRRLRSGPPKVLESPIRLLDRSPDARIARFRNKVEVAQSAMQELTRRITLMRNYMASGLGALEQSATQLSAAVFGVVGDFEGVTGAAILPLLPAGDLAEGKSD